MGKKEETLPERWNGKRRGREDGEGDEDEVLTGEVDREEKRNGG